MRSSPSRVAALTRCFVIADISGYTRFVTENDLEHAQGVLHDLITLLIVCAAYRTVRAMAEVRSRSVWEAVPACRSDPRCGHSGLWGDLGYSGYPGHFSHVMQLAGRAETLRRLSTSRSAADMTKILLALVPLAMVTGFLTWVMMMGARDQARSDAWAEKWAKGSQKGD